MSSPEKLAQEWIQAVVSGQVERASELLVDDFLFSSPDGEIIGDRDRLIDLERAWERAFSDTSIAFRNVITRGTTVVLEGVYTALHTGPFSRPTGEIPPTRRRVNVPFVAIFEIDGAIRSCREYWDNASVLAQLGAGRLGDIAAGQYPR